MTKLRVLCLHGFTSNGTILANQFKNITKSLSQNFEFVFPDGPLTMDFSKQEDLSDPGAKAYSDYVLASSPAGHRAWWFAKDANAATSEPGRFEGLEKSVKYIGELIEKEGSVDAVLGFSQGGCFAGLLAALLEKKSKLELGRDIPELQGPLKAAIVFSGFKPRFAQYDGIYEGGVETKTLHVIGVNDQLVTVERSEELAKICKRPEVLKFEGGHESPKGEEDIEKVVQFFRKILDNEKPAL